MGRCRTSCPNSGHCLTSFSRQSSKLVTLLSSGSMPHSPSREKRRRGKKDVTYHENLSEKDWLKAIGAEEEESDDGAGGYQEETPKKKKKKRGREDEDDEKK